MVLHAFVVQLACVVRVAADASAVVGVLAAPEGVTAYAVAPEVAIVRVDVVVPADAIVACAVAAHVFVLADVNEPADVLVHVAPELSLHVDVKPRPDGFEQLQDGPGWQYDYRQPYS